MKDEDPKTREEAVNFLLKRGIHAFVRDWDMGKTVGAVSHPEEHGGITVRKRLVYIAESRDRWEVHLSPDPPVETSSLAEACELAVAVLLD